jgi:hypothetical protein
MKIEINEGETLQNEISVMTYTVKVPEIKIYYNAMCAN